MCIQFQLLTVLISDLTKLFGIDHICYLNETPRLISWSNKLALACINSLII